MCKVQEAPLLDTILSSTHSLRTQPKQTIRDFIWTSNYVMSIMASISHELDHNRIFKEVFSHKPHLTLPTHIVDNIDHWHFVSFNQWVVFLVLWIIRSTFILKHIVVHFEGKVGVLGLGTLMELDDSLGIVVHGLKRCKCQVGLYIRVWVQEMWVSKPLNGPYFRSQVWTQAWKFGRIVMPH